MLKFGLHFSPLCSQASCVASPHGFQQGVRSAVRNPSCLLTGSFLFPTGVAGSVATVLHDAVMNPAEGKTFFHFFFLPLCPRFFPSLCSAFLNFDSFFPFIFLFVSFSLFHFLFSVLFFFLLSVFVSFFFPSILFCFFLLLFFPFILYSLIFLFLCVTFFFLDLFIYLFFSLKSKRWEIKESYYYDQNSF